MLDRKIRLGVKADFSVKRNKNMKSAAATRRGKWKSIFIQALRETGVVGHAAVKANIERRTAYYQRAADNEFAQEWDEALECCVDLLEEEADRRGMKGVEKPVFYQGVECGTIREYSDTLLIFRLKALRPEKYRERV